MCFFLKTLLLETLYYGENPYGHKKLCIFYFVLLYSGLNRYKINLDFYKKGRGIMEHYYHSVQNAFEQRHSLIIIGLTGRTGSGCSTTANILKTESFS